MADITITRQIFIGGCSRSGTTLLGAMLGAHPACITTPESHFKMNVLRAQGQPPDQIDARAALDHINRHWRYKIWHMPLDPADLPGDVVGTTYGSLLNWIVTCYAGREGKSGGAIWVDHTPENITYARTLLDLFPAAKIVHIIRDGRGVAASIMPLDWGPNTIIRAAHWWIENVSYGLALETMQDEQVVFRLKYEDLVIQPEAMLRRLCDFLGLDYHPAMAEAGGFKPPDYTASQHQLIGHAPDSERSIRWKHDLRPRQIEIFEAITRDYLIYLGYPLEYGLRAREPGMIAKQLSEIMELFQDMVINKLRWLVRSYPLWVSRDFLDVLRSG